MAEEEDTCTMRSTPVARQASAGYKSDESMIWAKSKDNTPYSISKFRSEMEVWRGIEEGLKAVIVNPVIILGPGYWKRGSSALFSRVARGLKYATPGVTGYVGVHDVVEAMKRLMASDISGERYILSSGDYSYKEITEMIASALGKHRIMREISPVTLRRLARLDAFRSLFTGRRELTAIQARAAFHQSRFNNEKIIEATGMKFTPVPEVVKRVAKHYNSEIA
jgi:nucleoside-diphosphate-sugar epimerase